MKPRTTFLAASAGILLLGAGVPIASAQADIYGTRQRPLEGRRYETMRALAHYLDESSQSALDTFTEAAKNRSGERKMLPQVQDFARRADSFHSMMDNYEANRRDVPPQVKEPLDVIFFITEDGLTSVVKRGENGGRTLRHDAVVRYERYWGEAPGAQPATVTLRGLRREWARDRLTAVAVLSGRATHRIYGAATTPLK